MQNILRTKKMSGYRAQAIVEFAIVAPILVMLLVGTMEVGRLLYIYAAVNNASREAARYGSAIGLAENGTSLKYQYCKGIRDQAKRSAFFMNLSDADITIEYDSGPDKVTGIVPAPFANCDPGLDTDTAVMINTGSDPDRINVTVSTTYTAWINLIPIDSRIITSSSARTILGYVEVESGLGAVPTSVSGPVNTSTSVPTTAPTATPTKTATVIVASNTPTATLGNYTPLPTNTATLTPTVTPTGTITPTPTITFTPTETFTPTPTSTPTMTPTAMPGCDSIDAGLIGIPGVNGTNTMSITIRNPHDAITISTVRVVWNAATGAPASKPLTLQYVSLGGVFWTGSNTSGDLTITPSTTLILPGNNATSTLVFTFDKQYKNIGNPLIVITLATAGCENYTITRP